MSESQWLPYRVGEKVRIEEPSVEVPGAIDAYTAVLMGINNAGVIVSYKEGERNVEEFIPYHRIISIRRKFETKQ